ncbi:MAG: class I SAM-dependent methyltransferase [Bdellovibrionaceae bacterium]|nr:class I SAM-dependent methyltransferase [Pseudobdellovibrionaceae bacterium]
MDLGCGNGIFVQYLKEKGYAGAVGFDPYVPQFSQLDPNEKFDFVIANDVIEHVAEPRAFLQECGERLAPNGILYVGTADSEDVDLKHLSKSLMKLHQPFHQIIMTQQTLEHLGAEMPGFHLLRSYRRSYMDTLKPFVNYRFLDEFNRALDHEMDRAFEKDAAKIILKKPRLLLFAFLGYFFPSAYEPAIVLKKLDRK